MTIKKITCRNGIKLVQNDMENLLFAKFTLIKSKDLQPIFINLFDARLFLDLKKKIGKIVTHARSLPH